MATPKFVVAIWYALLYSHRKGCLINTCPYCISSGGGIGGLTAALAFSRLSSARKDIHVDLYESVGAFTEIGAGVGLFRRPWAIMNALGIDGELRKLDNIPKEGDPPGIPYDIQLL